MATEIKPWDVHGNMLWRSSVKDSSLFMSAEDWPVVMDWLDELGLKHVRALAMFKHEGRYLLCVTQLAFTDEGKLFIDFASDEVAEQTRAFDLGTERTWPAIFDSQPFATFAAGKFLP